MTVIAWCVYCRSVIDDDADLCSSCGKSLTDGSKVIRCPSCGKYILKNSAQCRFCGADPHAKTPEPEQDAPASTERSEAVEPAASAAEADAPSTPPTAPSPAVKPAAETVQAAAPAPAKAASAEAAQAAPAAKQRKKRKWLLIPLLLVLAVGVFFAVKALSGGKKDRAGETRAEYVASCKAVPYAMIARDPARYEGTRLSFSGTITELVAGGTVTFHMEQVNLDAAVGSDIWYAAYTPSETDALVLREGGEITVYGECEGAETYFSQPGETVTIPSIRVAYCESAELERLREARQGDVFGVGETWTIDGLCTVTVTGVKETAERNPDTKKAPVAVYYVDYAYTNLGYESESADGIYVAIDETILDSAGQMGYAYPNAVSAGPRSTPVGETCEARCCVGVEHVGPFQLLVNVNDPVFNAYTARFNIIPE